MFVVAEKTFEWGSSPGKRPCSRCCIASIALFMGFGLLQPPDGGVRQHSALERTPALHNRLIARGSLRPAKEGHR
jgi:hypothetical protein